VQWGISGNITRQREWDRMGMLRDENHIEHPDWNMRGTLAFATTGPNTRGTQVIINYDDNHILDAKGFVPFGRVVKGMPLLSSVYSGYRERPQQAEIRRRGNAYLQGEFPRLSYIVEAKQVAFVEEPLVLSKNFTGLLITLFMVLVAVVLCSLARTLQRRFGLLQQASGYKTTAEMYEVEFEDEGEEREDGPSVSADSPPRPSRGLQQSSID